MPLVGCGATLGEGAIEVGAEVGADVGIDVGLDVGAGDGATTTACEAASATPIAVSADDAEYELDPPNAAVITYLPGTGGVHIKLYRPLASLVTNPRS